MKNPKITFLSIISKLAPALVVTLATISMLVNLFRANQALAQPVNAQASPYQKLQKNLIAQNPTEAALEISERGRTRALVDLLVKNIKGTTDNLAVPPSIERIKQVAKQQTGNVATETTVKQRMSQARIIHFATQANFGFEGMSIPGELAFAPSSQDDGLLKSEEIMNLNLNAELVVLSANDTALGRITADGVIGLSRSFFAAGVPSVVGSLWSPSDEKIVLLMTNFYENLSKKPDKAYALRQAMLTTMKKYPNPFDWAGFTLIGAL